SACVRLEADAVLRTALLKEEYPHFLQDPAVLHQKLGFLSARYGHEVIARWKKYSGAGEWDALVLELLEQHYDPAYSKSTLKHYARYQDALKLRVVAPGGAEMQRLARSIVSGEN
ncbi:MAG: tRNA 2-selenouridine(34) synthase MnmH, partial [Burkholderiales bacterium]